MSFRGGPGKNDTAYRAGTWHYRISADFLKFLALRWRTVTKKHESKHIPFEETSRYDLAESTKASKEN